MTANPRDRCDPGRRTRRGHLCRRAFNRWVLLALAAAVSVVLAGCTSESSASSTTLPVLEPSVTVPVVSTSTTTSTTTTGAPSTSTTETTEPTDTIDNGGVSVLGRGAPTTPLWKLAHQVANAMDGIDDRNVEGQGETTNFVEEAAFVYRSDSLYDVWLFFNPPDEESAFFSGEPLIEVATEDSAVGPVVFYKARAGSESIAPAAARVLVCDDTVQLWVLGEFPRETRDEVVAVAGFVDCTSMDS